MLLLVIIILGCSGYTLLRDPHHNKGLAFTEKERDAHYLRGLLPPATISQQLQEKKLMNTIRQYQLPLQKYTAMMELEVLLYMISNGIYFYLFIMVGPIFSHFSKYDIYSTTTTIIVIIIMMIFTVGVNRKGMKGCFISF